MGTSVRIKKSSWARKLVIMRWLFLLFTSACCMSTLMSEDLEDCSFVSFVARQDQIMNRTNDWWQRNFPGIAILLGPLIIPSISFLISWQSFFRYATSVDGGDLKC